MILPSTFDPLFNKYNGKIPVAFMRALSTKESGMNPRDASGPAWGLMQVVPAVLTDYNKAKRTSYVRADLLNAEINVAVASFLLNRIIIAYGKHPSRNMKYDAGNPEFWKLVTAGWNSGYSEGGGVGKVARYLENNNIPVTHENVFRYAANAGATKHLQNSAKKGWQKAVVDLYFSQPDAGKAPLDKVFLAKIGATVVGGLLIAKFALK